MMAISHTVCVTLLYGTTLKIRCAQNDNVQSGVVVVEVVNSTPLG